MAQDYSEAAALRAAKEAVSRLEGQYPGDPNKVLGKLAEMQSRNPISKTPTADEIFKQRIAELAYAYREVSDGKGGVDTTADKRAAARFSNALEGRRPDGKGFLISQQLAIHTGQLGHLTEDVTEYLAKNASKIGGLAGKAVGALAGVTVAFGASAGQATPSQLLEAGIDGAVPGLGTLTVGEGSTRGKLCKVFGDVVVPAAVGVGVSAVATPVASVAAGTAASLALSEPATNACNNFAQKLGL